RPDAVPAPSDFKLVDGDMPVPGAGEILCKTEYLSLDPYMRGQINGRHISGAIHPGEMMRGETVSKVMQSGHADFKVGDYVTHFGDWQSYSISDGAGMQKLDARISPRSLALGILGMPGLTAYAGLVHLAKPKAGDTVLVSAASGAVGSMVGQIAKTMGCRVIGIAGQQRKMDWLTEVAGFDGCFNYKDEDPSEAIKRLCPDGVNIYFDNVGGDILDAAMNQLSIGARVVLCGLMAQYNTDSPPPGPNPGTIIRARAIVKGLVVYDHFDKQAEFLDKATEWINSGQIKYVEDVTDGLAHAPKAFCRLMAGGNFGKTIVKL
ncbi:MAG: NADP-dependent oxidoreductase, partial [Robiginitomaculum sp.]|nr:NADP-dependent oxidoreductase [Robiginitomaculum sp.]